MSPRLSQPRRPGATGFAVLVCLFLAAFAATGKRAAASGAKRPPTPASGDQLALRALAVLAKHCAGCHGPMNPRAGLNVLSREELVSRRKVLQPGFPDASELLDLVAGDTMPPGKLPKVPDDERRTLHEWVQAGAPAPSPSAYTLHYLLQDWKTLDSRDRPLIRYVSLSHLLEQEEAAGRLAMARHDLQRLLASLLPASPTLSPVEREGRRRDGRAAPSLRAVDPRQAVYRLHLGELGWERQPFRQESWGKRKDLGKSTVNLYDLLLLEYPYAVLPTFAPFPPELADFLRQTAQVRPVPYLRGDWLVALLGETELYADLARLLGQKEPAVPKLASQGYWDEELGPAQAAAELGLEPARLRAAAAGAGLTELAEGKKVKRRDWELRFARTVERLGLGTALSPIDGLTWPDYQPDPDVRVTVEGLRPGSDQAVTRLGVGSVFFVRVKVSRPMLTELVLRPGNRQINPSEEVKEVRETWDAMPAKKPGWKASSPMRLLLTVYTLPKQGREAKELWFPRGVRLHTGEKQDRDRLLHPLYQLTEDGTGLEPLPGRMLKATTPLEVESEPPARPSTAGLFQ